MTAADENTAADWGQTFRRLARPHLRQFSYTINRVLGRFDERIWLIGQGRSGTTWVSGLINADKRMLERFEPFHPDYNPRARPYSKLLYRRPGMPDPALEEMLRQTFRAQYWNSWADQDQRGWAYRGILVKDVFASLLAKWALERLGPIKTILLIRNPFAVARSKVEKSNWLWADDIGELLADEALVADHLAPFEPMLRGVAARNNLFLSHIAIWAIVHYVLQRQFARPELHLMFYEDVIANPAQAQRELNRFLGRAPGGPHDLALWNEGASNRASTPEQVQRSRSDPYGNWRIGVSDEDLAAGRAILEAFGLDRIYDENGRPDAARMRFRGDAPPI